MTPRRALLVAVLLAGAGACGGDDGAVPSTTEAERTTTTPEPTSSTTQAPTTSESTTTVEEAPEIALRGDGLVVVELGAAPEAAISAVTQQLGEPTLDTGWQSSFGPYGTCPGNEVRAVEWDRLVLLFTDGPTPQGEGDHLFAWRLSGAPPALSTAEGFGIGATIDDARELYGEGVEVFPPEEPFPGFLRVDTGGGTVTAYLDEDVVTYLEGGTPCGE